MEDIQKLKLSTTQRREIGLNQIYYLRFDKSIILSDNLNESIQILREIFEPDYSKENKEKYKEFWDIIEKHELKKRLQIEKTEDKKQEYYLKINIEMKKRKIERLKKEIKITEEELNAL